MQTYVNAGVVTDDEVVRFKVTTSTRLKLWICCC